MDNQDVSKLKAKGRVELLILFLVLVFVVGGVAEYRHSTAPMSSAMVVFDYVEDAPKAQDMTVTAPLEAKAPVSELNPPKAQDIASPEVKKENMAEPSLQKKMAQSWEISQQKDKFDENVIILNENEKKFEDKDATNLQKTSSRDGAAELTDYMQEIHQKAEAVSRPQSALGQIQERQEVKKVTNQDQPVFEAGKIEIYDSEKGVVAVHEAVEVIVSAKTVQETDGQNKKMAEPSALQATENMKNSENTVQSVEGPAVDKTGNALSAEEIKTEANSVEPTKEQANVDANKMVTSEASGKVQPTLLVPVKDKTFVKDEVASNVAVTKPELKQNFDKDAPVDMIKAMQEGKAPVKKEAAIDTINTQENIVEKVEETSQNIATASEKSVISETKAVEEMQNEVREQIVEDKAAKSKKANEALENLFKKMSEPNALTASASEENIDDDVASVVERVKSESVEDEVKTPQPIENNSKNSADLSAKNADAGAVDLMKAIVSRK